MELPPIVSEQEWERSNEELVADEKRGHAGARRARRASAGGSR